jgi:hypothetical protein
MHSPSILPTSTFRLPPPQPHLPLSINVTSAHRARPHILQIASLRPPKSPKYLPTSQSSRSKIFCWDNPITRQLLYTLTHDLSFSNIFHLLLHPSKNSTAVCDGTVQFNQGTFGWVLATTTPPRIFLRCTGPASGSKMDSFRAEAYGLLSVTSFLPRTWPHDVN